MSLGLVIVFMQRNTDDRNALLAFIDSLRAGTTT